MKKSILYLIALCFIAIILWSFTDSKTRFGNYLFEMSADWNNGIPMNYFLFKENDRDYAEYYVNDFKRIGGYVYYTVVDGVWPEDDCYFDPNLQFKRINLSNEQVEALDPVEYPQIYQELSTLYPKDEEWLNDPKQRCSVKYPERWG